MYEYKVVDLGSASGFSCEALINELARDGWRLIYVISNDLYVIRHYFERVKKE